MKEFITIPTEETVIENVIEKSRFIAAAIHVDSVEDAMVYVNTKKKRYYDATHNCYAYVVGDRAKFSDDGEPQGTAGSPIYECLKNCGLDYVCVVVTRYFGGVKLGAGGLVRAYGGACSDVLKACAKLKMRHCLRAEVSVDYSSLKPLRKSLLGKAVEESAQYGDKVTLQYLYLSELSTTIADIVSQITLGKGVLTVKEQLLYPYDE